MNRTTQIALAHWANLYSQNEFSSNNLEHKKGTGLTRTTNRLKELVIGLKKEDKIIEMLPSVNANILPNLAQEELKNNQNKREKVDKEKEITKLVINTLDSVHIINIADIIYCESDKGYTTFYLKNKEKIIASKILSKYEAILPKTQFMRIHQSFLVNLEHILRYEKRDKNCVVTTNNYEIPVSHRSKRQLIDYFEGLC